MATPQWEAVKEGERRYAEMHPVTRYDELMAAHAFSIFMGKKTKEEAHIEVMERLTVEGLE